MPHQEDGTIGLLLPYSPELAGLARNPNLPGRLLDRFVSAADEDLCGYLADRDDLTDNQAAVLASRGAESDLSCAESLPDSPPWELARHPDETVRTHLAEREDSLPADLLRLLGRDQVIAVVGAVADHSELPADLARELAARPDQAVRDALAHNHATPPDVLAALLADGGSPPITSCGRCRHLPDGSACGDHAAAVLAVRLATLGNPTTPPEGMEQFLDHPDPWARAALAGRLDLTEQAYHRLASDTDHRVRAEAAANPTLGASDIHTLANDPDRTVRRAVLQNPTLPLPLLVRLAPARRIGTEVLPRIKAATPEELRRLAQSNAAQVRALVAARPELPAGLTALLSDDPDIGVAKRIAPNPALAPAQLYAITARHGPRAHEAVARNPHCPPELLHAMALAATPAVNPLGEIAKHPAAPPEALLLCLADPDERVRSAAAAHPALPVDAMAQLLGGRGELA
ncbi:hypothetical protein QMK19_08430 [Streptomyces sp. H10-C2]|uniref:variant leucine-rich repeat-containing protein n=1 Tax=unclassified Streptomyces TaxID=2593676 RepID=UPI0024B97C2F|nr:MULTISPECIES: hypothetical protein [unclassified Streptomyces]MDJ0347616.1 hypothetical protein [Streptomyces sp. PH10-H1]MDJ0369705.1 hypothetical protein [Streptomyces sp. H10-C2]